MGTMGHVREKSVFNSTKEVDLVAKRNDDHQTTTPRVSGGCIRYRNQTN